MSAPDRLQRALGEEEPIASTRLGGDDALVVTPTRSILYRAGGVLSEESITEFAHDAERITVTESRRKAKITLEYGLEGEDSFSVPSSRLETVLKSLLAVNLSTTDVIGPEETVQAVFFFDELTLVVTDVQVVKHVGGAIWDPDYETIPFEDVTGLTFESGRINTQVVLETGTTAERIKTPQDRARAVREALQDALCDFHGVDSVEALEETLAAAAPEQEAQDSVDAITLGSDFDLLDGDEAVTASASYDSERESDDALDGLYDDRSEPSAPDREPTAASSPEGAPPKEASAPEEQTAAGAEADSESDQARTSSVARASHVADGADDGETKRAEETPRTDDGDTSTPDAADTPAADDASTETEQPASSTAGEAEPPRSTAAAGEASSMEESSGDDAQGVDVEALAEQVEELATALDRHAELLTAQQRTIEALRETLEDSRE